METRARVSSKGQVTIPIDVRRALGIDDGDTLLFEVSAGYVTVRKRHPLAETAADLRASFPDAAVDHISRDAAVAGHVAGTFAEKESRRGRAAVVRPHGSTGSGA